METLTHPLAAQPQNAQVRRRQKETPVLSEPGLWLVAVEYPKVSDADEHKVEPEGEPDHLVSFRLGVGGPCGPPLVIVGRSLRSGASL
jgi:hypothetical protein